MSYPEIITGIDIGTSRVRVVSLQRLPDGTKQIIGVADNEMEGMTKGTIKSIEEAVSSVSECLVRAERMIGVPIENAVIGISGAHIVTQ